jgi:hypothetical protein
LAGSLLVLLQVPEQSAKPLSQSTWHLPDAQLALALAGASQSFSQPPQLLESLCTSTQVSPQAVRPAKQLKLHAP